MIVRSLEDDVLGTGDEVSHNTWTSRRLLLKKDGMGFSLHDTVIYAGTETPMWYKNHLEAVYCIEGEGEILDRESGKRHRLRPGVVYALDRHDRHTVTAHSDLRLICVFNPPCTGTEVHDEDGGYPPAADGEGGAAAA